MGDNIVKSVCKFFLEQDEVYVASTDESGNPHLAVANAPSLKDKDILVFKDWFCPSTIQNIKTNPHISVGVIDKNTSRGYQASGIVKDAAETSTMLNGFEGQLEETFKGLSQIQWILTIKIHSVYALSKGFHADKPL